jgi:Rrf2 family transcriptional regulator, repressor of oqxAB
MASGRFAMAVHALAVLSQSEEGYPSAYIASSVNTHAVFLRRILRDLVDAGLVTAREGRTGGYRLARRADAITLAEVYRAIEPEGPLAPSPAEPNPRCPIGAGMRTAFSATAAAATDGLLGALAGRTVEDVSRRALREGRTPPPRPRARTPVRPER